VKDIRQILREVPLIDGHNDLPWKFRNLGKTHADPLALACDTSQLTPPLATDLTRLRVGGVGGQFWAAYVPYALHGPEAAFVLMEQLDLIRRFIARHPAGLELALTADDVVRIHAGGKTASMIGVEGGHGINNSLAILRASHALGARYMTLTHVKNNDWADAGTDAPLHRGLTPFGEEVVREMNRLGMMVDLSHVSDDTMRAALKASRAPVICSHSGARALCRHARNVPDDLLKAVAGAGGIVMVPFLPAYLTEEDRLSDEAATKENPRPAPIKSTLKDAANHIDHIRETAGIDHAGIGSDFEGFQGTPAGLEDVTCYPALLEELRGRGYSESDLKKVAGENILRVMRAVEDAAAR
jgi:membrane dipeptidase